MSRWHDDEAYWEAFMPHLFPPARLEQAAAEAAQAAALLGAEPGASVLDLPCGPGRHSVELARLGFRVRGVDRTRAYVEEARRRAAAAGVEAAFETGDMRAYRPPEPVDFLVNLWTSFGYFDDPAEDARVARAFREALRPGGRLLMDVRGKEVAARVFQEREWHPGPDGSIMLVENRIERDWTWVSGRWILLAGGERREASISLRLYSAAELKALLEGAGFACRGVYGSLAGTPYDHQATRLVVVAERAA